MSEERKRICPCVAVLLVGMPVLYVASFGPACWLVDRHQADCLIVARIYRPIVRASMSATPIGRALCWYGDLDRPRNRSKTVIPMTGWMNFALSLYDEGALP